MTKRLRNTGIQAYNVKMILIRRSQKKTIIIILMFMEHYATVCKINSFSAFFSSRDLLISKSFEQSGLYLWIHIWQKQIIIRKLDTLGNRRIHSIPTGKTIHPYLTKVVLREQQIIQYLDMEFPEFRQTN